MKAGLTRKAAALTAAGILAAVGFSGVLSAQLPDRLDDQLRAIFERGEYTAETVGQTAWLDDGRRYTALTRGQQRDLVAYDTETGRSELLVAA